MKTLQLNPRDDVAIVCEPALDVPFGHKIALHALAAGDPIRKYGEIIGYALRDVAAGEWVHTHNLGLTAATLNHPPTRDETRRPLDDAEPRDSLQFYGYLRPDGRVGTRNYIAIVATSNCSADVVRAVARRCEGYAEGESDFDGVIALTTRGGCGVKPGAELELLRRTLGGFARHPNVAACVVIGLGCEGNQLPEFVASRCPSCSSLAPDLPTPALCTQQLGGSQATIDAGVAAVRALAPQVCACRRTPQSVAKLAVGLQCGGSDGFSGVTANPAVGALVDRLVAAGGCAVLSETPEIIGAEHLLLQRAATPAVADALRARIAWWRDYMARDGYTFDNNPAPGNHDGGLTTIWEKSLGAVAKGGSTALRSVVEYAAPVGEPGLAFMDTPGFDPVSATGQVAGGCQLLVFTTGRGSCFALKPVPTLKIATTSQLYTRMTGDMDVDAGGVLTGQTTAAELGASILHQVIDVASGAHTKSEAQGLGDEEFDPWIIGCTM